MFFDDIQWGEETFLNLVDHIADLSRGVPLLLLCVARPELLEKRSGWGGGKLNATTVLLEPLTAAECIELIAVHGGVEADLRSAILAAAGATPSSSRRWSRSHARAATSEFRPRSQALLQARIDHLGSTNAHVIESGAVEGRSSTAAPSSS